jgi:hypothetical protein
MIRRKSVALWVTSVATTGTAVLVTVVLPASAQAATGVFSYDAHGTTHSITNPAPGACLNTLDAVRATNRTNGPIEVYSSSDCNGSIHTVEPGGTFSGDFNSAKAA